MDKTKRIALLMGQDIGYCRGLLRGIHTYAVHKNNWVFRDGPPDMPIIEALHEWRPHGIIAHLYNREFADKLIALRKPLVNTTSTLSHLKTPLVEVDHHEVGRLAAEHFLQRGFKHFGYYGSAWAGFSKQREEGFRHALAQGGYTLSSCYAEYLPRPPLNASWKRTDRQVREWLLQLPKPAAILASNDIPARHLAEMCRQIGLQVPYDIALLGVDNDELECLLSHPPLSSVVAPSEQIGYEAAQLLDRLMSGHRRPQKTIHVPPPHIVTRESTDIVAIADPEVSAAVAYIRDHAGENIGAAEVVQGLNMARRGVERRFRSFLGRTILQEIQRVRIERAKHLLAETNLPMPMIAVRSGFSTPQRLAAIFRQVAGQSPSAFRKSMRVRP